MRKSYKEEFLIVLAGMMLTLALFMGRADGALVDEANSVVQVQVTLDGNSIGLGTGVHCGGGYILTAGHNLRDARTVSVRWNKYHFSQQYQPCSVLQVIDSGDDDIALIKCDDPPANEPGFSDVAACSVGQTANVYGYALGKDEIRGIHGGRVIQTQGNWAMIKAPEVTNVGHSGGAVFTNEGKLIGIATAKTQSEIIFSTPQLINKVTAGYLEDIKRIRTQCAGGVCPPVRSYSAPRYSVVPSYTTPAQRGLININRPVVASAPQASSGEAVAAVGSLGRPAVAAAASCVDCKCDCECEPGPPGPRGATGAPGAPGAVGPRGPGPTQAELDAAVARYFQANPVPKQPAYFEIVPKK